MLLPAFGLDDTQGLAMRTAWGWPLAIWDIVGACVAIYYWSLRRHYGSLMQGAQLFQDLRQREQQALELNDAVLQGLVVAKMALDLDQPRKANEALTDSIQSASRIITDLLGSSHASLDLLRSVPAAAGRPGEHPAGGTTETGPEGDASPPPQKSP
jgi:signal transduction histidine kinase